MSRILAIMAALLLMLSHGAMGEAAPHPGGHDAHAVTSVDVDAHHADAAADDRDTDGSRGACHMAHVHNLADMARADVALVAFAIDAGPIFLADRTPALDSRGIAPLLEPPAA